MERNGLAEAWRNPGKTIVIRRTDIKKVHDYAREHECLRDYLLIRFPLKIGVRATEVTTLKIEHIDFENRTFKVLDAKKKQLFTLPLDMLTLELIHELIDGRKEGYVFRRIGRRSWHKKRCGEPLSRAAIWYRIQKIGLRAGVREFNFLLLRHYFAATWVYVEKKSIEGLRRILRHKNLFITHRYLQRLVFFEDLQREYEAKQNKPVINPSIFKDKTKPLLNDFYEAHCKHCLREPTCKLIDEVCASSWATGCRYFIPLKKVKAGEGSFLKRAQQGS